MKVAFIFLFFFFLILIAAFIKNYDFNTLLPLVLFKNPFEEERIIAPLPAKDPAKVLEKALKERDIAIESPPIASGSALLVKLKEEEITVLFSADKDLTLQVGSLQIILGKLTMEEKKAKRIDFRFEDPIVVY